LCISGVNNKYYLYTTVMFQSYYNKCTCADLYECKPIHFIDVCGVRCLRTILPDRKSNVTQLMNVKSLFLILQDNVNNFLSSKTQLFIVRKVFGRFLYYELWHDDITCVLFSLFYLNTYRLQLTFKNIYEYILISCSFKYLSSTLVKCS